MIEIFICEDNDIQRKRLTEFIEDYLYDEEREKTVSMELKVITDNPTEILDYLKNKNTYGVYFLDVDLNQKITGIDLANMIREYDKRGEIIFITTHGEMMPLTFEYNVKALDYIVKDQMDRIEEKVIKCLNLVNERYQFSKNKRIFYFKKDDRLISEEYDNILYFEKIKSKNIVVMHTKNGFIEFKGTLKELESMDECLCRCNSDILVNMENISEVNTKKREVKMINGSICQSSVRLTRNLIRILEKNSHKSIF